LLLIKLHQSILFPPPEILLYFYCSVRNNDEGSPEQTTKQKQNKQKTS